jgi:pyruvate dehydrogenase E2 component (dihydrolipoamide acetyltransferase)
MVHAIRMPKPGQMTEECVLTVWLKQVGDPVKRGDVLFEIETDKSNMEVEAFDDGVLLARLVEEGQTVPVNSVCGYVGAAGEAIPEEAPEPEPEPEPEPAAAGVPADVAAASPAPPSKASSSTAPSSVAAARAAADGGAARLRISPRASRMAAEAGLDPRIIAGTGPEGRIVERDVKAAVAAAALAPAPVARLSTPAPATAGGPVAAVEGEEPPRPLSRMRRVIADRLTSSWQTTPHFTVTVAVDVTRLLALRAELKSAGTNLTVTDFVLAATAQTLAEFPDVNSRTDGVSVFPRRRVHLGVAVAIPTGLVVPVIRDADRRSVAEIHDLAAALAAAAREGTLAIDDMTGSTFTVSNLGMFGVEEFSAIINPGEAAILAVSSALPTPVALHDGIAVRSIMKLTLSADHRLVDGEMGARFLNALRRRLEDDASMRTEAMNA